MASDHSDNERKPVARLAARDLLYAPSHRQDITYQGLCFNIRGSLAETRNNSMVPQ